MTATKPRTTLPRWLLGPATDEVRREQAVAAAFLRVLLGLMWLYNVAWKRPPDFGQDTDSGLYHFTSYAVSHPVFPPYSWVVEELVLPNIVIFGWGVLIVETALAVLLLTGAWVRVAAALGVLQSLAIGLSVAYGPHEWPWAYWLMIGAHVAVLFSSAGRVFALDAVRAGTGSARTLGRIWGAIALITGVVGVILSAGDPLNPRGEALGSADPSLSLGEYNVIGGLVLVLAGGLLLLSALSGKALAGRVAAVVAAAAAATLYIQVGFGDPLLGGNATSAAFLLTVALVAAVAGRAPGRASPRE
ncbi:hypothetical protein [Streptomyces sp. WMMB 322]|uniref:Rv1678 family membrane protein n=1 Tax=Streptomyces sp. WMMB 322 TaxID=1286821 RepID=UPI0008239A45|nr:hypothetical protein [Streptomyces sp. WMMB 322]SCK30562.1 hypothetical protein H180DRAFT_02394 [Streptomyces sp. WMMB 322]